MGKGSTCWLFPDRRRLLSKANRVKLVLCVGPLASSALVGLTLYAIIS